MDNINIDELKNKFPDAYKHWVDWFEKWKEENDWDNIFNIRYHSHVCLLSFDDLPFAIQNGILAQYELELFNDKKTEQGKIMIEGANKRYKSEIEKMFQFLQRTIIFRQSQQN